MQTTFPAFFKEAIVARPRRNIIDIVERKVLGERSATRGALIYIDDMHEVGCVLKDPINSGRARQHSESKGPLRGCWRGSGELLARNKKITAGTTPQSQ